MRVWRSSLRTRLQATFVLLALAAIGLTVWVASVGASAALREATYERLAAIRQTRQHALERYFEELGNHVVALSTSETTALALEELRRAWPLIPEAGASSPEQEVLTRFYEETLAARLVQKLPTDELLRTWLPADPRMRTLQYQVIAASPYPVGSKDLLLELDGAWGEAHARHHPTFHRYLTAFGFYDIFLITAPEGRIVYSVMKEVDLGATLTTEPYRSTRLGEVYARAVAAARDDPEEQVVIEDYAPYFPSGFAPAAFVAAPVRVAGETVGVLAMQLSIREVDRVMTGGQRWADEGLGVSGQAYVIGADNTLRSDLRPHLEDPERFYERLHLAGVPARTIDAIRHDQTAVLNLPVDLHTVDAVGAEGRGAELGLNLFGQRVLRSRVPLDVPELRWTLVAEIDEDEAFAPVRALQGGLLTIALGVSVLFFAVAGWLGASVTRPILELAQTVAQLGAGVRGATVPVRSEDEVGELARAFNRMSADLDRTTVSKVELERLAGRLLSAQEDERRRVARELHDDLVQRLAATAIEVGRLERVARTPDGAREAHDGLLELKRTLARLSEDVHRLSRRIHPAMLDELGLTAGLESECRAFMERGGPPVDLHITAEHGRIDEVSKDVALALFRIVQESLRNAWQHAAATEVTIDLTRTDDEVRLRIADNGRGFARNAPGWKAGLGLASMEERARLLGGTMTMASAPGQGTRLEVRLPAASRAPTPERVDDEETADSAR
ncbi:MAG: ATP-binding protein [Vicinamibacterales bacterium]